MITFLVAAIQQAPQKPAGQQPPVTAQGGLPEINDIAPPVTVPMPAWQWVLIIAGVVAVLALLVGLFLRWYRQRPSAPPPTPRAIALRALERLRHQVRTLDPYQFSIEVSDVLRTFVGGQFGLHAREQTSPEFLAAIANAPGFTSSDRQLLADFLERCDLIKFARVQADERVSEELLTSAAAFVQGGRA